uniref:Long-chain-fatty-acid--CoA ligase n=1 Tax=Ascaris suum TaxID=6253 RepID=F1KZF3_ASCSU
MKSQTKLLSDGSRVAACLIGEELLQYNFEDARTLCEAIRHGERVSNNGPMLGYRQTQPDGSQPYVWLTYRQVIDRSINFAYGLLAIGIIPGQETFVAIYAKNRPEWTISELAVYNNSSVVVSLYDTLGATSRSFIINQASIEVVICDDEAKAASLVKSKHECPTLKYIVMMCDFSKDFNESANAVGISVYTFMEIEKRGSDLSPKPPLKAPKPCDVCTICYTSGTTGVPKGVILTHGNIIAATTTYQFLKNTHFTSEDVVISYLPLAHMYERVVENMVFQFGARVGFFRGDIKKLGDDIKELKPTFVPLVPRILTRIFDAVIADVQKSFIRKRVFNVAIAYKKRLVQKGILRTDSLFDKAVFKKIREQMGGRVRFMSIGSAPIAADVLTFARAAMGCIIVEGYGQTECSAIGTSGLEADTSPGHVGIPLVCSAIKLVDVPELGYFAKNDVGEICIRGHNVFKGYYKNEEATRETIDENGWLHSGDIGKWTENGTLKIIDRKKHIFKLQQGEYIAPEKIENVYGHSRYISQVFVHGESLKTCLVAIVVPDEKTLRETAKEEMGIQDATLEELCSNAALKKVIMDDMIDIGKKGGLQSFEQVKDIYVSSERFTIENDLLTPTLKGRRPNIQKHFAEQIEEMYSKLK